MNGQLGTRVGKQIKNTRIFEFIIFYVAHLPSGKSESYKTTKPPNEKL